jgi:CDGSH-type Zn-finger protein
MDKAIVAKKGPFELTLKAGSYCYCTCGRSQQQPFCDGSHSGTSFSPLEFVLDKKTRVTLCGCKQTSVSPHCDGSHEGA